METEKLPTPRDYVKAINALEAAEREFAKARTNLYATIKNANDLDYVLDLPEKDSQLSVDALLPAYRDLRKSLIFNLGLQYLVNQC